MCGALRWSSCLRRRCATPASWTPPASSTTGRRTSSSGGPDGRANAASRQLPHRVQRRGRQPLTKGGHWEIPFFHIPHRSGLCVVAAAPADLHHVSRGLSCAADRDLAQPPRSRSEFHFTAAEPRRQICLWTVGRLAAAGATSWVHSGTAGFPLQLLNWRANFSRGCSANL